MFGENMLFFYDSFCVIDWVVSRRGLARDALYEDSWSEIISDNGHGSYRHGTHFVRNLVTSAGFCCL
jgi:hypothetical protein